MWVWVEEAGEEDTGRRREGLGRELLKPCRLDSGWCRFCGELRRGGLRLRAASVVPNPVLGGRMQHDGGRARTVGERGNKTMHLFFVLFCLFVYQKKTHNWNCLIFKKKHSGPHP